MNSYHRMVLADSVYGLVVGDCARGIIIRLEDGREVLASFDTLPSGTKVLCSVPVVPDRWNRVTVDAVITYAQEAGRAWTAA